MHIKVRNPHEFARHKKYTCNDETGTSLHNCKLLPKLVAKQNPLPSLPSLANKISRKTSLPYLTTAQSIFILAIRPKQVSRNGGHFTKKYILISA